MSEAFWYKFSRFLNSRFTSSIDFKRGRINFLFSKSLIKFSSGVWIKTIIPLRFKLVIFDSFSIAPAPIDITLFFVSDILLIIFASLVLNSCRLFWLLSTINLYPVFSINSSVSIFFLSSKKASSRPVDVLPQPDCPIKTMFKLFNKSFT